MGYPTSTLRWPLRAMPSIGIAILAPLADRAFAVRYLSPTHAIHLHQYEGVFRLGRREYRLRPGDLTVTPAGVPSWYDLPRAGEHWCVHFRVVRNRTSSNAVAALPTLLSLGPRRGMVAGRMAEITRLWQLSRSNDPRASIAGAAAAAALQELLLSIALLPPNAPSADVAEPTRGERAVERCAAILDARLLDAPSVPELADAVELTQNYLARRFRQRFGMTIPRYVLSRRIDQAALLLSNTQIPIGRVAMRVGLPDAQHFNKQFRRLMGVSPSEWRTRHGAGKA